MHWKTLFENEAFILVDKMPQVLTVPSRMGSEDPRPCLGIELQAQLGRAIYPIHRLDFEVSGLVVFAKTPEAQRVAGAWFEGREVKKTYLALSAGSMPDQSDFVWKSKLLRGKKRAYESPVGKPSVTEAHCLGPDSAPHRLRWRLHPVTGRPHQLRYEMYKHGYPILGDKLYGSTEEFRGGGIALRAVRLDLPDEAKQLGLKKCYEVEGF